jgi:mono/diheme cytochrome c family protein
MIKPTAMIKPTILLIALNAMLFAQTPVGAAARGKDLFGKKYMCYTCHGWDGHGGFGATLAGLKLNQNGFMAYVRRGGPGTPGVGGRMPAYTTKTIPDEDLADIYAYVKAFPAPSAANRIPLLNQILNQNQ